MGGGKGRKQEVSNPVLPPHPIKTVLIKDEIEAGAKVALSLLLPVPLCSSVPSQGQTEAARPTGKPSLLLHAVPDIRTLSFLFLGIPVMLLAPGWEVDHAHPM